MQCRATNYYQLDYTKRLLILNLLPLMDIYEVNDLMFFYQIIISHQINYLWIVELQWLNYLIICQHYASCGILKSVHALFPIVFIVVVHPTFETDSLPQIDITLPIFALRNFTNYFTANFDPTSPCCSYILFLLSLLQLFKDISLSHSHFNHSDN